MAFALFLCVFYMHMVAKKNKKELNSFFRRFNVFNITTVIFTCFSVFFNL